jgi:hypothetical protein
MRFVRILFLFIYLPLVTTLKEKPNEKMLQKKLNKKKQITTQPTSTYLGHISGHYIFYTLIKYYS